MNMSGYHFLVESTTIGNATILNKSIQPKIIVNTNRMGIRNGPITKNVDLSINISLFFF